MDLGKFARSRLTTWLVALMGIGIIWLALSGAALADDAPPACGGKPQNRLHSRPFASAFGGLCRAPSAAWSRQRYDCPHRRLL